MHWTVVPLTKEEQEKRKTMTMMIDFIFLVLHLYTLSKCYWQNIYSIHFFFCFC